jgi:amidohydrolase
VEDWRQAAVRFRRALHQIPELGFEEVETSAYLEQALREMGLVPRRLGATGLMADVVGEEAGATVLVRADMDGLPLTEASGQPFASRHPGVMHACGHDGHMAMVLALALRLVADRRFAGRVRILFQPAEERPPGGALAMIAAGCLEGVDRVLGLHLWTPLALGEAIVPSGPVMANADEFSIHIEGRGGHAAAPQQTVDAVVAAAHLVVNLQAIVARRMDPLEPAVLTCGSIRAGDTFNVIAETAEVLGTVRTLTAEAQARMREEMERVVAATAALYGARAQLRYVAGYPAVINAAQPAAAVQAALAGWLRVRPGPPSLAGEDFAYYLRERPGVYFLLGAQAETGLVPHHSPRFDWDERALVVGTEALWRGVWALMEEARGQNALA